MKTSCKIIFAVLALFELSACGDKKNDTPPCLLTVDIHVINVDANTKYLAAVTAGGVGPYEYLWSFDPFAEHTHEDTVVVRRNDPWGPKYDVRVNDALGCHADDSVIVFFDTLNGSRGDPRCYLRYTNYGDVDLDLHVRTPSNQVIFYNLPAADGGRLDLDCNCADCTSDGIENI